MFEVSSRQHPVSLEPFANLQHSAVPRATASGLSDTLLSSPLGPPMDNRSNPEYSQTGLPSPHPSNFGDTRSEESSSIDSASAAQYSGQPEARPSNAYSTSATPTSEYGVFPQSARSGTFSEGLHRAYHPSSSHSGSSGGMAQQPTSPSMPMQDGRNHQNMQSQQLKSDSDEQIDPSLAQPSPTSYNYAQQSPYGPPATEMAHGYGHPGGGMYQQPRPDWANYHGHGAPLTPGHPHHNVFPATPTSSVPQRGNQVSLVLLVESCWRVLDATTDYTRTSRQPTAPSRNYAGQDLQAHFIWSQWLTNDFALLGLQLRPYPWRPTAQATEEALRGD